MADNHFTSKEQQKLKTLFNELENLCDKGSWSDRPILTQAFKSAKSDQGIHSARFVCINGFIEGATKPTTKIDDICYLASDYVAAMMLGCRLHKYDGNPAYHFAVKAKPIIEEIKNRLHW